MIRTLFQNFGVALVIVMVCASAAKAGVNPKNGNFYITFTDISQSNTEVGRGDVEIERTYNSRAPFNGVFGIGWGSDHETTLSRNADGTITLHSNGSGVNAQYDPKDHYAGEGQAWTTTWYGGGEIIYDGQTYKLSARGELMHFGPEGLMQYSKNSDGLSGQYTYDNGLLTRIEYSNDITLDFAYYASGLVKSIAAKGGSTVSYTYSVEGNLIGAQDTLGNAFTYSYDHNHNMTSVRYLDQDPQRIEYTKKTELVAKHTSPKGCVSRYVYGSDPERTDQHYWTWISKRCGGDRPEIRLYEYEVNDADIKLFDKTYSISVDGNGQMKANANVDIISYNTDGLPVSRDREFRPLPDYLMNDYSRLFE